MNEWHRINVLGLFSVKYATISILIWGMREEKRQSKLCWSACTEHLTHFKVRLWNETKSTKIVTF